MMRLVGACRLYPGRCAVLPHLGGGHETGYIDTGQTTPAGERVYVSVIAAAEIARMIGFTPARDGALREQVIDKLRRRIAELERELAERDRLIEPLRDRPDRPAPPKRRARKPAAAGGAR